MKEVFDQMEAEVDQHVFDKKCDEIKRKNLLIKNQNLIAKCLSKDVFYTATDYVLTVSRFSATHDAYNVAQKRIVELEGENFNLKQKIQTDDHDEMIKHFSKLEVDHLNLQLKYQHLKERFGNKKLVTSLNAPAFESVFKHSEADPILDFKALDSQNKDLNAKANALQDLNEHFRVENKKVKQHYKELYDSIKLTRAKTIEKTTKKQVTFVEPGETSANNSQTHVEQQTLKKTNVPMIPSTGVKYATAASGLKPRSNKKKDRTLPAKSDNKKVEDHSRNNKSSMKQKNYVDSIISYKRTVINWNSNSVCKTCNKCLMSFNHDKSVVKSLKFVKKPSVNKIWRVKPVKQVWHVTRKLFTNVGFQWQPTGRKFTLGEQCPLTRFTESKVVPVK
ncbi:hypothetical protein Tco_1047760 [Tanacetum coccineum]